MRPDASFPPNCRSNLDRLARLLLVVSLAGCGDPCRTESEQTEVVMTKAREAKVDLYLPARWEKAQELVRRAESACREGREADELHRQARKEAGEAISEARAMEGVLRQEALNARYAAGMAIEEAHVRSLRIMKHPEDPRARDFLSRLKDLDRRQAELQSDLDRGDYLGVRARAARIREEAVALEAGTPPPAPGGPRSPGE
jgi:hypothetical protein